MREKVERGSLNREGAAVRLTESEISVSKGNADQAKGRVVGGNTITAQADKSFRSVLVGDSSVPTAVVNKTGEDTDEIPILEAKVEEEFLQTLIGNYMGRMKKGVEIRALQMKLCMDGLQAVKVAAMGGNLVLFSQSSNVEFGALINNIQWWEDLLEGIIPWTPNQVRTRRKLWVRMYGVPLHVWGNNIFQKIATRCGKFIEVDDATSNKNNFDLDSLILEDQLRWSVAASSCHSGGGGPVMAMLEGLDGEDFDCGDSETCQQEHVQQGQRASESTGGICLLEEKVVEPLENTVLRTSIPSIVEKVMETEEVSESGESSDAQGPRLLDMVGRSGQLDVDSAVGVDVNPMLLASPTPCAGPLTLGKGGQFSNIPLIENFDNIIKKSRGKHTPKVLSELSEGNPQPTPLEGHIQNKAPKSKFIKNRKSLPRLSFPEMVGHRCLRLVGAINGGKMPTGSKASSTASSSQNLQAEIDSGETLGVGVDVPGNDLTVVLTNQNMHVGQSGVQTLLHEDSIQDVDGSWEFVMIPINKSIQID
ncbi:hypothetical protein TSUD_138960 [Trifolium subterraneum]|uniref:Uncharacterized protein n=1 Tax=Trifolium subterraneum TaxID=3900 RepID=A0A2Z6PEQ0_TRISU|nr:hypothetical protein TSUD_138960 [Trifolium subterraneum]